MIIHPQSFRALAYEVLNHLNNNSANDDSRITLPIIEQELRHQFGIYLKETDRQTERQGMDPEAYRVETMSLSIAGDDLMRVVEVVGLLTFNGKPYTSFVGIQTDTYQLGFVPVDYRWQLLGMSQLTRQPCFTLEGDKMYVLLTAQTIAVEAITLTGIPADPFPKAGRADEWYWKRAWFLGEEAKGKIKMQTLRVFMGTHIQLQQRVDQKNNATEG
ncbi:hypothetical protein [Spirosoma fluviale]|uniref:Uncharacterized protein n=1 Tax=Spirosoma fluviale TaxID=1597977 RepID=A0A286FCE6_9BACT|nr:hypothetical protein [Spirosoma fluviale]SOD80911.1 hypothetical protein SAMN06269250_1608 [Spirosoma fluviale]